MSQAVTALVTGVAGLVIGIVTTAVKSRRELEAQYDIALRQHRIDAYSALWKLLQPLSNYAPPGPVTYGTLKQLSCELRAWYFETGGLFLSQATREPYFNLQQALNGLTADGSVPSSRAVDKATRKIVTALASRVRTSCTVDVETRVGPRLGQTLGQRLRRPWRRRFAPLQVTVDRRWDWNPDGGFRTTT